MNPPPGSTVSCEQVRPPSRGRFAPPLAAVLLAAFLGEVPRESALSPLLGGALLCFWIVSAARAGSRIALRLEPEGGVATQLLRAALYGYAFVVVSVVLAGALHRLDHVTLTLFAAAAYLAAGPARALQACRVPARNIVSAIRAYPFTALVVTAGQTKNGRQAELPLVAEVVEALREHRPTEAREGDKVFRAEPRLKTWKRDLRRAGIIGENDEGYRDDLGRQLDRKCLRMSFCTWLKEAGVDLRDAQALMRHRIHIHH